MRAIGFDLGGTLVYYAGTPLNWKSLYPEALPFMASRLDLEPSEEQIAAGAAVLERYNTRIRRRTVEVSPDEVIARVLDAWSLPPVGLLEPATDSFFYFFQRDLSVYEDTFQILETLKGLGTSIGILTDVPYGMKRKYVLQDLAAADQQSFVDALITSVDVSESLPVP